MTLIPSTDDRDRRVYIVSRWAMCRQLDSLEAVEQWLEMVTGKAVEAAAA
ncbi:MAG: hypothetical protein KDH18_03345 [Rhodoferax sp.]|nr:hypothetical protein [Rhodoferax sp.]MCB2027790.1 hypothetical protein [Rhodoferax sp.]